jgi:hypothetical protein
MATKLAFQTPGGGAIIPGGETTNLAVVSVSPFDQIRIVVQGRTGFQGSIFVNLMNTLSGDVWVGALDSITVEPSSLATRFYATPGLQLTLNVDANQATGTPALDVLVFGSA